MADRRTRRVWIVLAAGLAAITALLAVVALPAREDFHRVTTCGARLCLDGRPWTLSMATVFGGLSDPDESIARIRSIGLNTVRITDFLDVGGDPATAPFDSAAWSRVDRLIAAAGRAGLHVWLDLSTYRNLLQRAGSNPYAVDWTAFLRFVANRINTATGVHYADDPTIAVVGFAGEVDAVNGGDNTYGATTAGVTDFYRRVESFWHDAAPTQLLTAGGMSHLDYDSGIDWRAIYALPFNDIDAIHVYTAADATITLPAVAHFSAAAHKPWALEEFGYPATLPDADRARLFTSMYATAVSAKAAAVGFWNVGGQTHDTYDVGPQFPLTFAAARDHP